MSWLDLISFLFALSDWRIYFNFKYHGTALFDLCQLENCSSVWFVGFSLSLSLMTILNTAVLLFTFGSSWESERDSTGFWCHSSSFLHRNVGPQIYSLHLTNVLALTLLDAMSAGFSLVLMYLHCDTMLVLMRVLALMKEILLARNMWNLVCLFAMYFKTDWISVQKVDWLRD